MIYFAFYLYNFMFENDCNMNYNIKRNGCVLMNNNELFIKYYNSKSEEDYQNLFLNNINLLKFIILKIVKIPGLTSKQIVDEFIDVGYIGLTKAIKTFDKDKIDKVNFTTYAYACVKNEILKALQSNQYIKNNNVSIDANLDNEDDRSLNDILGIEDENLSDIENENYNEYLKRIATIIVESINDPKRAEILKDYFGLENRERLSYKELAEKYNCSQQMIRAIITRVINAMNKKALLINKDNNDAFDVSIESIQKTFQKIGNKSSIYMNKLLEKYKKEDILLAIEKLEEIDKKYIKIYLKLDEYQNTSYKNIFNKLNIEPKYFYRNVSKAFKKLDKILSNRTKQKSDIFNDYDIKEIEEAIKKLNKEDQKFVTLYIENGKSIKNLLSYYKGSTINSLHARKYKLFKEIKNIIENKSNEKNEYERLISKYDVDSVNSAILQLSKKYQDFINKCIELENDNEKIAKFYNIDINSIYKMKEKSFYKLETALLNNINYKDMASIKSSYKKLCKVYGKKHLDETVSALDEEDIELLKKIIEFDYKTEKILNYFKIDSNVLYSKVRRIFKIIEDKLDIKGNIQLYKENILISKAMIKYGKENVEKAFSKLDYEDKCFMDDLKKCNYKVSIYANDFNEKANDVYQRLNKIIKLTEKIIDCDIKNTNIDISELVEKYGEIKVNNAISSLKRKDKTFFELLSSPNYDMRYIADKYNCSIYKIFDKRDKLYDTFIKLLTNYKKRK